MAASRKFPLAALWRRAQRVNGNPQATRALDVIGEIEAKIGKPAVASNQAMIWNNLRLAGVEDRFEGYGRLSRNY